MQEKVFHQGDVIVREGDHGETFFQILKGSVKVTAAYGAGEKELTVLKEGQFFGEMAVLENYPRSATVTALEDDTRVLEIPGHEIDTYFKEQPEKISELFRHLSSRLRALTEDYTEAAAVYEEMGSEEKPADKGLIGRIEKLLSRFLGHRENAISAETQRAMDEADFTKGYSNDTVSYGANTVIFREGEPARCLYAIHWGKVGIYSKYGTPEQKLLTELMPGKFFGEMGVIDAAPRSATAVALEDDTTLEVIAPEDLNELYVQNPPKVDMILQNLSYRLRRLTTEYTALCEKISRKYGE